MIFFYLFFYLQLPIVIRTGLLQHQMVAVATHGRVVPVIGVQLKATVLHNQTHPLRRIVHLRTRIQLL